MRKILEATLTTLATLMTIVPVVFPATSTGPVNASVTVTGMCDLVVNPDVISFDSLVPGAIKHGTTQDVTASQVVGNTFETLEVAGNDWNTPLGFLVGQTHWGVGGSNTTYSGEVPLTSSAVIVNPALGPTDSQTVHFGLQVPDHQAAGEYSQTITFTFSCNQ